MKRTIRVSDQVSAMLNQITDGPTQAAQIATELFCHLRRATLPELKGIFTAPEISALTAGYNGIMPTWEHLASVSMFAASVEDSETLESTFSKQKTDVNVTLTKIKRLTAAQVAILQLELYIFWNNSPNNKMDDLIKKLT